MLNRQHQHGFTLVELVIAIVVLGVALAGVLMALNHSVRGSADPVVRVQMLALAQSLSNEVESRPFVSADPPASAGCARALFNDLRDYDGYASAGTVCAIDGTPMLSGYAVRISVKPGVLAGVRAALRIDVTVSRGGDSLTLTGWRTDFAS